MCFTTALNLHCQCSLKLCIPTHILTSCVRNGYTLLSLQGDTLQNVANDLKRIFETGHFSFIIPENIADAGRVELRYTPASKRAAKVLSEEKHSSGLEEKVSVNEETWDSEQTGAFARKLGFLDSEKAGGELVKQFLHANEVYVIYVLSFILDMN